ncbi:MAG: hypothetical protein L3J83_06800 [Proteobacteria bacterium]|nr:hypothetical protein [Pseudomonadota bacterium]
MKLSTTLLLLITLLINISNADSQVTFSQNRSEISTKPIEGLIAPKLSTFAEASQWADLVAVAQVDDIEYEQVRELNAKGYAFLNILISYKGTTRGESIAVLASGFQDNICYYPDRENEGERFLVFLKKAPDELDNVYYGFKPFCQFQVLLSDLGQYILRTPLDTVEIADELIEQHQFNDPHAMIDTTLWTGTARREYADTYQCKIIESSDDFNRYYHLRYTQGVPIYKIRPLLKIKYKPRISSKQM